MLPLDSAALSAYPGPLCPTLGATPPRYSQQDMAVVCRVLEEAWKLGQMSADDYHRAMTSGRS